MADLAILGIPGSLHQASFNRFALVAAQSLLPAGATLDIFATPEHNYSIPGVLKNPIDWTSPYGDSAWQGKPVAVMGASVGFLGSARAQYHLRQCAAPRFNERGELTDETSKERIRKLVGELVASARKLKS